MEPNPYESSKEGVTQRGGVMVWSLFIKVVRRFPVTSLAIGFASVITIVVAFREYDRRLRIEREGAILTEWSPLDALAIPGAFCAYVVVTITKSLVASCIAAVLGMLVAYGIPGLIVDLGLQQLSGHERESPPDL